MTAEDALQWLEDHVPPAQEPELDDGQYTCTRDNWVVTEDAEYRLNRAAADLCRQKAAGIAEAHEELDDNEQEIFDNWMRLAEEFDQLAALEETTTTSASSMLRTRSVANQPVW